MSESDVIVIGGGAAGMMSAVSAAEAGASVTLLEKNEKIGKKVFITGHGRCNVTNAGDRLAHEQKTFRNARFMRGALSRFDSADLRAFLERHGTPTKTESSGRVFPSSDKSSDVIRAFARALDRLKVSVKLNSPVQRISIEGESFVVGTDSGDLRSRCIILATGGISYPGTGSTGDGLELARNLGHQITELRPGLVGLVCEPSFPELAGLTVGNARLTLRTEGNKPLQDQGDVLFTHSGLSGPAVFRISCALAGRASGKSVLEIGLATSANAQEVEARLSSFAEKESNSEIHTILGHLIPRRFVPVVLAAASVEPKKRMNQLTRIERRRLADLVTSFPVEITGTRPIEEAIITVGGVPVREINPSSMESRLVPGLFFAGEIIDVSAFTGGYNLQIAFSSGWAAGLAAADCAIARRRSDDRSPHASGEGVEADENRGGT